MLSPYVVNCAQPWLELIVAVVAKELPQPGQPGGLPAGADMDDVHKWPWWKCKKWAMQILYRFYSRYGPFFFSKQA